MSKSRKTQAEASGRRAERWAAVLLRFKGYSIIASRVKTPHGEIDIIARKGRTLVFIEIKYRQNPKSLLASFTPNAQARITKAASYYVSRNTRYQALAQRFDLIMMSPWGVFPYGNFRHMVDAWRAY
ncbi:MAG: YraN family protein [Maricaulaceae bacterium]